MNCEHYQEQISPYLDDALSHDEKIQFEAHLKTCPKCEESLSMMRHMVEYLNNIQEHELPEGFHQELHQRLLKANKKSYSFIPYVSGVVAAVLIGVMILPRAIHTPQINNTPTVVAESTPKVTRSTMETSNYSMASQSEVGVYSAQPKASVAEASIAKEARGGVLALEEEWLVSSEDLDAIEMFIKQYCEEASITYSTWEQDESSHFVLQPSSKDDFREKLEAQLGSAEAIQVIEIIDTPSIHLIVE